MRNGFVLLKNKIKNKDANIAVVGLGYVGLPLAMEFVRAGFCVFGIDKDGERINYLKRGVNYIVDVCPKQVKNALEKKRLQVSTDFSYLNHTDVVLICVPTPLRSRYRPDISYLVEATEDIGRHVRKSVLIVLESTTYPGTTEEVILPLLEKNNLRHGRDFYLAFSPERIDPANKKYPLRRIPKIVSGLDIQARELAQLLYRHIVEKVVPVSSVKVAETAKLLENTFRLVNIALIDELAMMAHKMHIDIWEVIAAASTKPFGFMPFWPGPGVGGHCIPKDPLYLYWKARHSGFASRFIRLAAQIIERMPAYVVGRIEEALKQHGVSSANARVMLLGVTYKKDVKDLRKSPALSIISILRNKGIKVSYYDPFIPYLKIDNINLKAKALTPDNLKNIDCLVITTDHSGIDYPALLDKAPLIFDCRNVYAGIANSKVVRL